MHFWLNNWLTNRLTFMGRIPQEKRTNFVLSQILPKKLHPPYPIPATNFNLSSSPSRGQPRWPSTRAPRKIYDSPTPHQVTRYSSRKTFSNSSRLRLGLSSLRPAAMATVALIATFRGAYCSSRLFRPKFVPEMDNGLD